MRWSGNLDELATWARSPDVLAGPEFDQALESVPDDQVMTVEATLCAMLKADRDAFGPKTSRSRHWRSDAIKRWNIADEKLQTVRRWEGRWQIGY